MAKERHPHIKTGQKHKVTVSGDAADQLAPSVSDSCVSTSKSVSSSPRTFE